MFIKVYGTNATAVTKQALVLLLAESGVLEAAARCAAECWDGALVEGMPDAMVKYHRSLGERWLAFLNAAIAAGMDTAAPCAPVLEDHLNELQPLRGIVRALT